MASSFFLTKLRESKIIGPSKPRESGQIKMLDSIKLLLPKILIASTLLAVSGGGIYVASRTNQKPDVLPAQAIKQEAKTPEPTISPSLSPSNNPIQTQTQTRAQTSLIIPATPTPLPTTAPTSQELKTTSTYSGSCNNGFQMVVKEGQTVSYQIGVDSDQTLSVEIKKDNNIVLSQKISGKGTLPLNSGIYDFRLTSEPNACDGRKFVVS